MTTLDFISNAQVRAVEKAVHENPGCRLSQLINRLVSAKIDVSGSPVYLFEGYTPASLREIVRRRLQRSQRVQIDEEGRYWPREDT